MSCFIFVTGCAGLGNKTQFPNLPYSSNYQMIENVPPVAQEAYQCGPAALESVFFHWGKVTNADTIAEELLGPGERGVFNFMMSKYAREQGFWTQTFSKENRTDLWSWMNRDIPVIVLLRVGPDIAQGFHFVVVKGYSDYAKVYYANTGKSETVAIEYADFFERWRTADFWGLVVAPPEEVDWELSADQAHELAAMRFNLGNLYLSRSRDEDAKVIFEALAEEHPAWAEAHNNLAWIYLKQGDPERAIQLIESVFSRGAERRFDILDTLAMAYCETGDSLKTEALFREAKSLVPGSKPGPLNLIEKHVLECRENLGRKLAIS